MGRENNTYAKRQREMQKKRKAEDKRVRRQKKKDAGDVDETNAESRPASEPA